MQAINCTNLFQSRNLILNLCFMLFMNMSWRVMFGFSCNKARKCPNIPLFYYPVPCISIYINTRVILGNMALLCSGKYLGLGQYYVGRYCYWNGLYYIASQISFSVLQKYIIIGKRIIACMHIIQLKVIAKVI